ncbi:hypothetical protein MSG28_007511 [Choristoneura fumiferana]|uniref:Uncharacterized protein n=1 Tax=Choristoneura fumiferana TaxID=7141 RepID=A0ACC0JXC8_CHOFU|nr:hypothetical protein MSG28_007511 [Choristoneura fumiferana]
MKFALVALACMLAAAHAQIASFNRASTFAGFPGFPRTTYRPQVYRPVTTVAPPSRYVARVSGDANAQTLKFGNDQGPDGSYNYFYETDNGIAAQEQGTPRNFGGNPPVVPVVAQGSYSWTSPEGEVIAISYIADENGYQPVGNAIPTPPPVPPQIARALEYIARNAPRQ